MSIPRRLAALEHAPGLKTLRQMTLGELVEEAALLVGQHDPAAAQRIRDSDPRDALAYAFAEATAVLQRRAG